jgi:transcription initiation factor IIE alpha subunit
VPVPYFLLFLYFIKVVQEIFSALDETKSKVNIYQNEDEVHMGVEEVPQGGQTCPRCGLALVGIRSIEKNSYRKNK